MIDGRGKGTIISHKKFLTAKKRFSFCVLSCDKNNLTFSFIKLVQDFFLIKLAKGMLNKKNLELV